jgi:hypothetical protein
MLADGERVYYYCTSKGCLGLKKTFFVITDSRVICSVTEKSGCLGLLGLFKSSGTLDIPLEHISGTQVSSGGCVFFKGGSVAVQSGTASNSLETQTKEEAQEVAGVLQNAMREIKKK